jgi:hypothetical protein
MLEAIQAVKDKEMSCRGAAKHFRVPFATLRDRVAGTSGGDVGRPTELMKEDEAIIVERVILMGTWGSPCHGRTSAISSRGTWTGWAGPPASSTTCQGRIS